MAGADLRMEQAHDPTWDLLAALAGPDAAQAQTADVLERCWRIDLSRAHPRTGNSECTSTSPSASGSDPRRVAEDCRVAYRCCVSQGLTRDPGFRNMLQRPAADEYAPFYAGYVARVPDGDLVAILRDQFEVTAALFAALPADRAGHRYAPGKWTVKQVVGHMTDVERVLAYRLLRFARADATPLPGFDESEWAVAAGSDARGLGELVDELLAVRRATLALMEGLPGAAWTREGVANGTRVTVRAIACIIAGHELHHREILETRYGL